MYNRVVASLFFLCFLVSNSYVFSQNEEFTFDTIQVSTSIPSKEILSSQDLASQLEQQTGIFIKTNGAGTSGSISIRGGSASQTNLTWNGLEMSNPMLGQVDVSLFSLFNNTEIALITEGNKLNASAVGMVSLNSSVLSNRKIDLNASLGLGSFGLQYQNITFSTALSSKLKLRTTLYHLKSKNDYPFQKDISLKSERLEHAAHQKWSILQEVDYIINENHFLTIKTWLQNNDRDIPPTIFQSESLANQTDKNWRTVFQYIGKQSKWDWNMTLGHIEESILYSDDVINLSAPSSFQKNQLSTNIRLKIAEGHDVSFTSQTIFDRAIANNLLREEKRIISHFTVEQQKKWNKLKTSLALTVPLNGDRLETILPNFSATYNLYEKWVFAFYFRKFLRFPSINDWFWTPGGNPNLKPEKGFSHDLKLNYNSTVLGRNTSIQTTLFYRTIKNRILWSPLEGQGFWSAQNLNNTKSYGIELRLEAKLSNRLSTNTSYQFIKSFSTENISLPVIRKGAQLWYVPMHQTAFELLYEHKKWNVKYKHIFHSKMNGVLGGLAEFDVGELNVKFKTVTQKNMHLSIYAELNNIWNQSYFLVEGRPAMGRNFELGIHYNFSKNKKL